MKTMIKQLLIFIAGFIILIAILIAPDVLSVAADYIGFIPVVAMLVLLIYLILKRDETEN